ncbi:uncharacterized protein LOC106523823 [Austrofundulus limnaeus]|uniref:Uncharacterized protein LOC106523823 n=1 Tax=Austrofundulus limnaeus TaxID=52670 RepID=A0A2I4BYQ9_AUSLI|nr:PREDICTED: uncharacterized protein LOC106523823 [Austrofundulus limnaeus]
MNNVFTVGGRVTTLNSNASSSRLSTTPPSPTAVAINLLNVLKIANTMSHPLFNPFVPGTQTSSQGQYGLSSGQTERDPRTGLPRLEPGSSYPSGPPPLILGTSGGFLPPPLAPPGNYIPERSRITVDDDIERCLDLNIGRPKEEVRHQPLNQSIPFISTQRQGFPPSNTEVPSYMAPSALQGHRPSTVDSTSRSLDWLPMFKRTQEDDPSKMYSSASSNFVNSGDGRFNISNEGMCDTPSIPGFGNYERKVPERSALPAEPSRPKYTSESASNILLQFGLEKEDLEQLITYPEDQITPQNLPFILREIQLKKAQRTAAPSKPYSEPPPIESVSGSRAAAPFQDEIQSIVLKPSKVIDYGHTSKYTAGIEKDVGNAPPKAGGSKSNLDSVKSGSHIQKPVSKSAHLTASTSQPSSSTFCSIHPNRPGLVLIDLNNDNNDSSQSRAQGEASKVKEPVKKQQGQQPNQQVPQQPKKLNQAQQPKKLNQAQQQQKLNQAQQQQKLNQAQQQQKLNQAQQHSSKS